MKPVIIGLLRASLRAEMMRIGTQDEEHAGFDFIRNAVLRDMELPLHDHEQIKDANVFAVGMSAMNRSAGKPAIDVFRQRRNGKIQDRHKKALS